MTERGPPQPMTRTGLGRAKWRRAAKVADRVFRDKTPRPGGPISDVSAPGGGSQPGRVDRAAENRVEWFRAAPPGKTDAPGGRRAPPPGSPSRPQRPKPLLHPSGGGPSGIRRAGDDSPPRGVFGPSSGDCRPPLAKIERRTPSGKRGCNPFAPSLRVCRVGSDRPVGGRLMAVWFRVCAAVLTGAVWASAAAGGDAPFAAPAPPTKDLVVPGPPPDAGEPGSPLGTEPRTATAAKKGGTPRDAGGSPLAAGGPAEPAIKDLTPPTLPAPTGHPEPAVMCPPPGDPEEHTGGLFGRAEYLLLRPRRGAFDFALADPARNLIPAGPVESLNYGLRSGLRAALGYQLPGGGWDVLFGYTYLRSGAGQSIAAPTGGVLYPTLTRPGLTDYADTASATASLEYNVYDLEIGRRFRVDERLTGRVFGGVRWVTVRQDFVANYNGQDARDAQVRTKANFDGFGPVVGGEGALALYRGFHVYARGSAGLLTGRLDDPLSETNDGGATQYANLSRSEEHTSELQS